MKKENQRIKLTKRMLRDSLLYLLQQESIHKISIRELCEYAGINRSTFYKNYGSQYALLAEMEEELLEHIREGINKSEQSIAAKGIPALTDILIYIEDNLLLCKLLINNNIDPEFPIRLLSMPQIQDQLQMLLGTQYTENQVFYLYTFITYGCYHIVREWINREAREPVSEIAEMIAQAVGKHMEAF